MQKLFPLKLNLFSRPAISRSAIIIAAAAITAAALLNAAPGARGQSGAAGAPGAPIIIGGSGTPESTKGNPGTPEKPAGAPGTPKTAAGGSLTPTASSGGSKAPETTAGIAKAAETAGRGSVMPEKPAGIAKTAAGDESCGVREIAGSFRESHPALPGGDSHVRRNEDRVSSLRCLYFNEKDFWKSVSAAGPAILPVHACRNDKNEVMECAEKACNTEDGTGNTGSMSSTWGTGSMGNKGSMSSARNTESAGSEGSIDIAGIIGNTELVKYSANTENAIAGGVVPHHLLAGDMIAQFFRSLSESSPRTVVIIGPNHGRIGQNGLHTCSLGWGTAFGVLEADREIAAALAERLKASESAEIMEIEHSVSSLVPYVKYYMPEAKIVPILLHGNYGASKSQELGRFLAEAAKSDPRIAVVASVDFSHYLDAENAEKMDAITLDAIISRDIRAIAGMGNDNLDSPPSILALLSAMDETGATGPEVIAHDNSYGISGGGADCTTSYFTMLFKRQ